MMFGLTDQALDLIRGVFAGYPAVTKVEIFGSRAMGTQRHNSDIDLALWGEVDQALLGRIAGDLDELPLPYLFDVMVFDRINEAALREHIERYGRVLYSRESREPVRKD